MPHPLIHHASVTSEAMWVVGVAQGSDDTPLHILPAHLALCTELYVVVMATVVAVVLHEVAAGGQQTAAHYKEGGRREDEGQTRTQTHL